MTDPLPPQGPQKKTNWWLIGCGGCLGLVILGMLGFGAIFYGVIKVIKSTEPYKTALTAASNSPQALAVGTTTNAGSAVASPNSTAAPAQGRPSLLTPTGISIAGIFLAYVLHLKDSEKAEEIAASMPSVTNVLEHKYWVDEIYQAAIFEPFFRVEGHRSRASGGVGLGLAIARRSVELHQGRITAHRAEPGLQITIELPQKGQGAPPSGARRASRGTTTR